MAAESIPTRQAVARSTATDDDELPDTALFWRWVGKAVRPYAGWIITGIGVVFIIVGYLGVSREALVAKQLPYLISGGVGGMAFVGIGAVFLATEDIRRDSGRLDRLEAMAYELHAVLLARPDAPETSPNGKSAPARPEAAQLMALPQGQTYHLPECTMIHGKDAAQAITADEAEQRGLNPCRLCEPVLVES